MKEIMQTYGAMIVAVVVGIALLSGFGALKNKMSVAFAPQDILSSDSANDSYDSMKNIPVPGIELKEKMRQNAVSYSVYDLLDVTAHEDNLDKPTMNVAINAAISKIIIGFFLMDFILFLISV